MRMGSNGRSSFDLKCKLLADGEQLPMSLRCKQWKFLLIKRSMSSCDQSSHPCCPSIRSQLRIPTCFDPQCHYNCSENGGQFACFVSQPCSSRRPAMPD